MKVLLIEDEPKLVASLQKGLEEHGIAVDSATNGLEGLEMALRNPYNVIVSDVLLPGMTGIELVRALRQQGGVGAVLLLTALGQMEDKVSGFEAGADDYLTKPFEFKELLLRVQALARRTEIPQQQPSVLRFSSVEMNLDTKEVFREGQKILLTPREFALMEYFVRNPGRSISKAEISEQVWNLDFDTGTNVIEVYVNFLRKKIERGFRTKLLHTQFKTGYILREETDTSP
jgi:two-component system copper resistance phosphate regulon response regulator CusR